MLAFAYQGQTADSTLGQGASSTGRAGEYFAAYVLESYGVEAHRVDTQYSDLWCRVGEDVRAVEVKTCTRFSVAPAHRKVSPHYRFNVKSKKHGWFCLVALDIERLLFRPVEEVTASQTLQIQASEFTLDNQRMTIERFLESC